MCIEDQSAESFTKNQFYALMTLQLALLHQEQEEREFSMRKVGGMQASSSSMEEVSG